MGPSAGQDGFNPELPAVHFLLTLCLRHSTCCFMVLHTESPGSPSPLPPHHTTPTPTHPQPPVCTCTPCICSLTASASARSCRYIWLTRLVKSDRTEDQG